MNIFKKFTSLYEIFIIFIISLLAFSCSLFPHQKTFIYQCDKEKSIEATYTKKSQVHLKLSDGRSLTLSQSRSGSGIRYANSDETFVYWSKGRESLIKEKGKKTYKKCYTKDQF